MQFTKLKPKWISCNYTFNFLSSQLLVMLPGEWFDKGRAITLDYSDNYLYKLMVRINLLCIIDSTLK